MTIIFSGMQKVAETAALVKGQFQPVTGQAGKVRVMCGCGTSFIATLNLKGLPNRTDCKKCAAVRLGEARVSKTLHDIALIGNLANSQYEFEDYHKTMIISALQDAVRIVSDKFNKVVKTENKGFSLSKPALSQQNTI